VWAEVASLFLVIRRLSLERSSLSVVPALSYLCLLSSSQVGIRQSLNQLIIQLVGFRLPPEIEVEKLVGSHVREPA